MKFSLTKWIFSLLFIFSSTVAIAQTKPTGRITGTVIDSETGEAVIGANVVLKGTTRGAATDVDGAFSIASIEPGSYTVVISAVSYRKKEIVDVVVSEGQSVKIDVALIPEAIKIEGVEVQGKVDAAYEGALLTKQRKSASISDGISAEQIRKTPDATSSDALKRITGISIVDNKFVYIRGITDRYNGTTLNGSQVTSTEVGKKSFAFDMIPANLLENTVVVKSATPDLPGDVTGGMVQLSTLDFPDKRVLKVSISSALNSFTTSKEFWSSQGGSSDWLGIDDGSRSLPANNSDGAQLAKILPNNWAPRLGKAPMNTSFSFAIGDHFDLSESEPTIHQIGFIAAGSYKNGFQRSKKDIHDVAFSRELNGATDEYSVLWGALLNVSYKMDGLHKISFKNSYNNSSEDEVRQFNSEDRNTTQEYRYTVVNWNERSSYQGQLSGEHILPFFNGLSLNWKASLSRSARKDPDRKEISYYHGIDDPSSAPFYAATNQRSWATLSDRSNTFNIDFALPIGQSKIKVGSFVESRKTNSAIRYFNIRGDFGISDSLLTLPIDKIYAPENFGRNKFLIEESSNPSDSYDADQQLLAGYLMADVPIHIGDQDFRFVGGARWERSEQNIHVPRALGPNAPTNDTQLANVDLLPSANLTYSVNERTNLRFAFSHSVNRPEFREIASTGFYDFIKYELVGGNPDLQRAYIRNYDARLEIFPDAGELMALSYFHKRITGAIEEKLIQTATRSRSWFNSDFAKNYGWELEVRKSLRFLGGYFGNFSVMGNYTKIQSEVDVIDVQGNSTNPIVVKSTRPLQGQSPYMINLSFQFTEPTLGTTMNVLYNKFGRRLDAVGFLAADIYEEPRTLVDLSITQSIGGGIELKLNVRNLTNQNRILTRDNVTYETTAMGVSYSVQVSTNF